MNRFVAQRSLLFLLFSWFLVGTLFADGANLDDLFPSNLVVHDDEDVASATATDAQSSNLTLHYDDTTTPFTLSHPAKAGKSLPGPVPLRVVVDQDSPSIAADPIVIHMKSAFSGTDSPAQVEVTASDAEPLYLRLCTLLI